MIFDLIAELPVFLAYSLLLQKEAVDRFKEYSSLMRHNNQTELAQTFDQLAFFSQQHVKEIEELCKDIDLPKVTGDDLDHSRDESPASLHPRDKTDSITTREALETMLLQEQESAKFYQEVANRTVNQQIRKYALTFAKEETEHASALQRWLEKLPA